MSLDRSWWRKKFGCCIVNKPENSSLEHLCVCSVRLNWHEERETNKTQLIRCLISIFCLMFRPSLCPSSREQDLVLPHMLFCIGCAGCGCVELERELFALFEDYCSTHAVQTARIPAPHNHSQHKQCRTPYAVIHDLVLLKMGITMPETCWDRSLIINIGLVASVGLCLFTLRSGRRSQETNTSSFLTRSVQIIFFIQFQHHTNLCSKCSISSWN